MNQDVVDFLKPRLPIEDLERIIGNLSAYIANFNELGQVEREYTYEPVEVVHGKNTYRFSAAAGLCHNCLCVQHVRLVHYAHIIVKAGILDDWIKKYGVEYNDSFWVAGQKEFMNTNLCNNPRRLHAAIWLRHRLIDVRLILVKSEVELK